MTALAGYEEPMARGTPFGETAKEEAPAASGETDEGVFRETADDEAERGGRPLIFPRIFLPFFPFLLLPALFRSLRF